MTFSQRNELSAYSERLAFSLFANDSEQTERIESLAHLVSLTYRDRIVTERRAVFSRMD